MDECFKLSKTENKHLHRARERERERERDPYWHPLKTLLWLFSPNLEGFAHSLTPSRRRSEPLLRVQQSNHGGSLEKIPKFMAHSPPFSSLSHGRSSSLIRNGTVTQAFFLFLNSLYYSTTWICFLFCFLFHFNCVVM